MGERPTKKMKTGFINVTIKILWPEAEEATKSFLFGVYDFEEEEAMDFMARQITYAMKSIDHEFLLRNAPEFAALKHYIFNVMCEVVLMSKD